MTECGIFFQTHLAQCYSGQVQCSFHRNTEHFPKNPDCFSQDLTTRPTVSIKVWLILWIGNFASTWFRKFFSRHVLCNYDKPVKKFAIQSPWSGENFKFFIVFSFIRKKDFPMLVERSFDYPVVLFCSKSIIKRKKT